MKKQKNALYYSYYWDQYEYIHTVRFPVVYDWFSATKFKAKAKVERTWLKIVCGREMACLIFLHSSWTDMKEMNNWIEDGPQPLQQLIPAALGPNSDLI